MSLVQKVTDFLAGGTVKTIVDTVKDYFPPSMSEKEKADLSLVINNAAHQREKEILQLANEADREFNQRIKEMEGTAADLKSVPFFGTLIIFLRGTQRPIWGFFTLYADFMVLSKTWDITQDPQLKAMLIVVNVLVLTFLFGERAVKNVMPFIMEFFGAKK
jgi:hypothetical protein